MSVRRFVAANSRDAMRQVREALGDDALILSNRQTEGGVEVLALAEEAHDRMTESVERPAMRPTPARLAATYPSSAPAAALPARSISSQVTAPSSEASDFASLSQRLLGEMQEMRDMLTRQHRPVAPQAADPLARLRQRLWIAGVGPRLTNELLESLPRELNEGDAQQDDLLRDQWLQRQLVARLTVPGDEAALFEERGVIALVGPTGIGKTTTTAKLAARYVMRHGREGVALVTTDSYRIGAHEQLRIYAGLLGVEVHAQDADAPLDALLGRLADKHLVIIDTVGMSQRDQRLVQQIAQLSSSGRAVRLMLLLNAASHGDTLEDVIVTYRQAARAAGNRLDDCIMTKLDEAAKLGPLLDGVMRHGLRLHYVSHGQKVPEDLSLADAGKLVSQALDVAEESPYTPDASMLDAVPARAQRFNAMSRGLLGQGRTLGTVLNSLRQRQAGFSLLEAGWELASLPNSRQRQSVGSFTDLATDLALQEGHAANGLIMLWGAAKVSGCDWALPVQAVNANGELLASAWPRHELPAGSGEQLEWASNVLGACGHVFASCPDLPATQWLAGWQLPWASAAKRNSRVRYAGERHELGALVGAGKALAPLRFRYRGQPVSLALNYLPVQAQYAEAHDPGGDMTMWVGELVNTDSGRSIGRKFWLSSRYEPDESNTSVELIKHQLLSAELPVLVRRGWQKIQEAGHGRADADLRLRIASSLAAVALRLDLDSSEWAMDVRAQLLGLLGGQRPRHPNHLLEALCHLFLAQDGFRAMGNGLHDSSGR
ncbi:MULTISPECIES: flagellar biosynthesis protein FlhF [Halomonadaceae]|uniref:flagellar biosynthesis protein FlhF n=1 Tax=Halomonadaceae TaxID=28256 RepID=UPI001597FB4A|nr:MULTISPECIES: flagellar biosynthesis protein FlhF [Halomonas]QJQ96574.1 flagellar biosynthesis protein FlhF [Halomonas sp. PA5]